MGIVDLIKYRIGLMIPDERWRRLPTLIVFACQLFCALVVLGISANDINFDLVEQHAGAAPRRLVFSVVCSTFTILSITVSALLWCHSNLHPLFVLGSNVLLGFFWTAIVMYQKVALENLREILAKLCPLRWKHRWLWCANPKMTFSFSVLSLFCCIAVVIWAAMTWARVSRLRKRFSGKYWSRPLNFRTVGGGGADIDEEEDSMLPGQPAASNSRMEDLRTR